MPIASGVATTSAMTEAQRVPKTNGQTYSQNGSPLRNWVSSGFAVKAGTLSTMRKSVTAARTIRMMMPAPSAVLEKTRSPRRRVGRRAVSWSATSSVVGGIAVLGSEAGRT
ncbi:hypothetical protein QE428_001871 [Microbacterium sp. SORGH_AS 505]|nr:hypothetical protein [Microbacterium sp. SORGH_AS_0505]